MADKLKHPEIYIEEGTGREYQLRGCHNQGCFCTGHCRDKIYLDGNNDHINQAAKFKVYISHPRRGRSEK